MPFSHVCLLLMAYLIILDIIVRVFFLRFLFIYFRETQRKHKLGKGRGSRKPDMGLDPRTLGS